MKKAQTEIVGLMIIVVIISVGMLFYLSYSLSDVGFEGNVSDSIRKEYIDNELSMSFVQTLVRTTIPECNDLPLDVLIKDVGTGAYELNCFTSGKDIDQFLDDDVLSPIKERTLDFWGKSYYLAINYNNGQPINDLGTGDCKPGTIGRRPPGIQPIPYYPEPGTAFLELAICNK